MPHLKRAISVDEIYKMSFVDMPFEGDWIESFGEPERSGVWLIWGHSGNGKTDFAIQLSKYLTQFGNVAYNTLEEGARKSFQMALQRNHMHLVAKSFVILSEDMKHLRKRLARRKSADIIIIDSFQHAGISKPEYIALKKEFPAKLFIFLSHADGKHPEGRPAKFAKYDADIKIFVQNFEASIQSRYGGGEPFTIWDEGAAEAQGHIKS
jgi:hypothetical protein